MKLHSKATSNLRYPGLKKIMMFTLPIVLLIIGGMAYMTQAEEDPSSLSSTDKAFLLDAADARMLDWAEGNLATQQGTTQKYRQFGKRMTRDQDKMMAEIKKLAASKNLALPENMSEEKTASLDRLKKCTGESFNRRYRRTIIMDLKGDINNFKEATKSSDSEISAFATQYLPLLEQQLEQARDLNK